MAEAKKPSLLRRIVRYGLPAFGVAACAAGLYVGYCERQTQATVAQLRLLTVRVEDQFYPFPWWQRFTNAVGLSPKALPVGRREFQVVFQRPENSAATLRLVAKLPGLRNLAINHAPDCDDAALAIIEGCTSVEMLSLENTSVTDVGIRHFSKWDRLHFLRVKNSPVTDASKAFARGLPSMRTVNIDPN